MKCHNCGADIPDGHLYCDKCGAEINIVPEFEPEVENEIDTTLSSIADRLSRDDKPKVVIKYRNKDDFFEINHDRKYSQSTVSNTSYEEDKKLNLSNSNEINFSNFKSY